MNDYDMRLSADEARTLEGLARRVKMVSAAAATRYASTNPESSRELKELAHAADKLQTWSREFLASPLSGGAA